MIRLYRLTDVNDTSGIDFIDFNSSNNTNGHYAFCEDFRVNSVRGISDNQAAGEENSEHQDLGKTETVYILSGFVSKRSDSTIIQKIKDWDDESSENDNYVHGRFGISFDDFTPYDVSPIGVGSNQVGLLLRDVTWSNSTKNDVSVFQITLVLDRGD